MSSDFGNANTAEPSFVTTTFDKGDSRAADRALFLGKFLTKGRVISSIVPSSQSLVRGVLKHVDFSKPATIVELGAGIGPVTERVLERLQPFHRFVAVENDPDFCEVLRRRFPDTSIIQADATRVAKPLAGLGIQKVDYVLSGLPTPSLPHRAMIRLRQWLREALTPNGLFIQITVVPFVFRRFYGKLFDSVEYKMVWWNMPPGGVYRCSAPRGH
ncbi:MAG: class I SAM-dependent methyltransferase [Phycisphaerae bacterium]